MFKKSPVDATKFTRDGFEITDLVVSEIVKGNKITCKGKNCAYCCTNSLIGLSYLEFMRIKANQPKAIQREPLPTIANSIMHKYINDNLDTETLGDCPFLVNKQCAIYKDRPLACRTFFSIDDPKLCEAGESHHLINSSSNNVTKHINESFQEASIDAIPDHAYLDIRDFFHGI